MVEVRENIGHDDEVVVGRREPFGDDVQLLGAKGADNFGPHAQRFL